MEFNLADVNNAVAAARPDAEAIVFRDRRLTYAQFNERTCRLAHYLLDQRLGVRAERDQLRQWESGQAHLALYLHNGNEYLEGMLGAYQARVAPFNVNYRYVEEELVYLLNDSRAQGIIFHSCFAPRLAKIRADVPSLTMLLQVPDESGHDLVDDARWYEEALAESSGGPVDEVDRSPDDLYILYTGGTTGMPKGVLWRQGDIFPGALGGRRLGLGEWSSLDEIADAARHARTRMLPAAPFMHGAAHWLALSGFTGGNTIVIPRLVDRFDAADLWSTVEREGVGIVLIVGDAFGRPLLDELDRGAYDLSRLRMLVSGGAALSARVKQEFLAKLPGVVLMDGLGASETGQQAAQIVGAGAATSTGTFTPGPGMCIISDDLTRVLPQPPPTADADAGDADHRLGWLAQSGNVPLGYLDDEAETTKTFPEIDGVRYSVPGDRARVTAEGLLELHGRDSVTINSGGEKIFAEEVEAALAHHPAVYDAVVAGRPSDRWGQEVVAIVQLRPGFAGTGDELAAELLAECEQHIARFKLPKQFRFVERIERSPAGKADYRWARRQADTD